VFHALDDEFKGEQDIAPVIHLLRLEHTKTFVIYESIVLDSDIQVALFDGWLLWLCL
jgi:hypothetical protein